MHKVSTESSELMKSLNGRSSDLVFHLHKLWDNPATEAPMSWLLVPSMSQYVM